MRLWPSRKKPEPEPEGVSFPVTPYAGLLTDLIDMGLTAPQVVYVVHLLETAQAQAELRIKAEMNVQAAQQEPRATKPRNRRATPATRPSRAEYYRKWRARNKLQLVRNHGGDVA